MISKIKKKSIEIKINSILLDKYYNDYYFVKYPKRKARQIKTPNHPSINSWMIMKRPQMNSLKQAWKEFMVWVIDYYKYSNLKIGECDIIFKYIFKTKRRRDPDNMIGKFSIDGLVESGLLKDDSCNIIKSLTIICDYGEYDETTIYINYNE